MEPIITRTYSPIKKKYYTWAFGLGGVGLRVGIEASPTRRNCSLVPEALRTESKN